MDKNQFAQKQNIQNEHNEYSNVKPFSQDERKLFVKGSQSTRIHYNPEDAAHYGEDIDDPVIFHPSPNGQRLNAKRSILFRLSQFVGVVGSVLWIAVCLLYFAIEGGLNTQTPYEFGIFMAGMIAPVAFFWMLLSYMQRNTDVRYYAESMRNELHTLFFPSDEDSVRVNKDIERMTQQAADLAASSKASLKAIHRARMGLRHEIKQFAGLARQAENHILALSDGMVEKTGSLVEQTDLVQTRIDKLTADSDVAMKAWEEAGALMIERAAEIETTMDKGANRILAVADVAEEKSKAVADMFDGTINSLGLTVDAVSDRLNNINDNLYTHTHTLERTSVDLSKESGRLNAVIDDQIEQLSEATGRTVESITQSVLSISDQKDSLTDVVADLASKSDGFANIISGSVDRLNDSVTLITDKAETIESRITEKSSMIAQTLNGFDAQIDRIDSISDIASHRLSEGIDTAVNGASQISEAIHRGIDKMENETEEKIERIHDIIDTFTAHIDSLKKSEMAQLSQAQRLTDLLEQSQKHIDKATHRSEGFIKTLNATIEKHDMEIDASGANLSNHIKDVTRALEEPLRLINIAIADADGRHEQIQSTLERRVKELKEASDNATQSAETIRYSLKEQTQDLSALTTKMTAQSQSLSDNLKTNKSNFENTVNTSIDAMERLVNSMTSTGDNLENITGKSFDQLTHLNEMLNESSTNLDNLTKLSETNLKDSLSAYRAHTDTLHSVLTTSVNDIAEQTDFYKQTSLEILPMFERVEKGSKDALSSLNDVKNSYKDVSEETLDKIEMAANGFDARLQNLQNGSEEASTLLRSSGDYLRVCLDNIQEAASSAHDKMHAIGTAMESQSSNIHIVTDKTTLRIESIQKLIHEQFTELSEAVENAVQEIEAAGDKFDTRADKVSATAEDVLEQIIAAGDGAESKAYDLKQATKDLSETSDTVVKSISSQMVLLEDNSKDTLSNLTKTADTLSIKSKEIDSMMKSVLSQAKSYGSEMRDEVNLVALKSGETAAQVGKAIDFLAQKMQDVDGKTRSAVDFINETNQSLYEQSSRFITAVKKSSEAAKESTALFSEQSDRLLKASDTAVQKAEHIKSTEIKASRDTFLSSARFVLESLNSLSIDFIRMIDGEVSDKDWKAYQKGDIAVFTTQLASRLQDLPADKIRNKYEKDTEFRTYVRKFTAQFDDILHQTDTIDRGAILSTTFAASDVGKIYHYLVGVVGADSKGIKK